MKGLIRTVLAVVAIIAVVLGAHGVFVYFSVAEAIFGGAKMSKLFLEFAVPIKLAGIVSWMSIKGLQSWFIPAAFIVGGYFLWQWRNKF